jgi:2-oxoglutarate dehydrogenase E1 component
VIDRAGPNLPPAGQIRRLILCSGKIYVDLVTSDLLSSHPETGIARLEQLAPFPREDVSGLLAGYPALDELVWAQEEPQNMGAWDFVRPHLEMAISGRAGLKVVARPPSASPAEGSNNLHTYNQRRLIEEAFGEAEKQ